MQIRKTIILQQKLETTLDYSLVNKRHEKIYTLTAQTTVTTLGSDVTVQSFQMYIFIIKFIFSILLKLYIYFD